jgi:hypothetical protein
MKKDERDLLDVLKAELAFLEKGGYGRSPRAPWRPQLIFEDSPTCMNYDSKDHPDPCSECLLMQFVPPESRNLEIPCRHIPFNAEGDTLASLYRYADQYETEDVYGKWLRDTIARIEVEREARSDTVGPPATASAVGTTGQPLFQNLNPKCANPACPTAFHWLGGGKFFRFRVVSGPSNSQVQPESGHSLEPILEVKHYWLCEPCSHLYSLAYDEKRGALVKLLRPELPSAKSSKQLTAA